MGNLYDDNLIYKHYGTHKCPDSFIFKWAKPEDKRMSIDDKSNYVKHGTGIINLNTTRSVYFKTKTFLVVLKEAHIDMFNHNIQNKNICWNKKNVRTFI